MQRKKIHVSIHEPESLEKVMERLNSFTIEMLTKRINERKIGEQFLKRLQ